MLSLIDACESGSSDVASRLSRSIRQVSPVKIRLTRWIHIAVIAFPSVSYRDSPIELNIICIILEEQAVLAVKRTTIMHEVAWKLPRARSK